MAQFKPGDKVILMPEWYQDEEERARDEEVYEEDGEIPLYGQKATVVMADDAGYFTYVVELDNDPTRHPAMKAHEVIGLENS
jgi:hypothetical protein